MPKPVVLITGASGFLATRLIPLANEEAVVVATSRQRPAFFDGGSVDWRPLDLLDPVAVSKLVAGLQPHAIIHAAASNPGSGEGFEVNVGGAAAIAAAAASTGARLVHVSSDIVHSGREAPYADDAEPDPINDYGRSKADGEASVLATCPEAVVARTSLIYGLEVMDRGTAGFAATLERGETLSLWGDALRQPVWIDALCDGLIRLALRHQAVSGPLNLAGEQTLSRAGFGRRLLEFWGVDTSNLTVGSAATVPGQPLDLTLSFERARALTLPLPGVDDVLAKLGSEPNR